MSDNLATGIVTIALGILGVATLAVIFSKNANTAGVINAGGSALATDIQAAVSPITGGGSFPSMSQIGANFGTASAFG